MRLLGWALEIFNSLPISSRNPRETIVKAARAIEDGDIICIFPEGQLTRSGCLTPIRRGMEMIARRTKAPIIPVYIFCNAVDAVKCAVGVVMIRKGNWVQNLAIK